MFNRIFLTMSFLVMVFFVAAGVVSAQSASPSPSATPRPSASPSVSPSPSSSSSTVTVPGGAPSTGMGGY